MNRGHDVALFDKGRGPGGRMLTRRLATSAGEACFDHGAQYFTVRDAAFRRRVDAWSSQGAAAPWPSAGSETFVGVPGDEFAAPANVRGTVGPLDIARDADRKCWTRLAAHPRCRRSHRSRYRRRRDARRAGGGSPRVDCPASCSPRAGEAERACWTTMLAFSEPVAVAEDCRRGRGIVGWAARNSSKPGRTGPESWVVQAGPAWSKTHIEADPQRVTDTLKDAFSEQLGVALPACLVEASHRWRFARSGAEGSGALFEPERRLGLCGDWLMGPRVEAAWLSGAALAKEICGSSRR